MNTSAPGAAGLAHSAASQAAPAAASSRGRIAGTPRVSAAASTSSSPAPTASTCAAGAGPASAKSPPERRTESVGHAHPAASTHTSQRGIGRSSQGNPSAARGRSTWRRQVAGRRVGPMPRSDPRAPVVLIGCLLVGLAGCSLGGGSSKDGGPAPTPSASGRTVTVKFASGRPGHRAGRVPQAARARVGRPPARGARAL